MDCQQQENDPPIEDTGPLQLFSCKTNLNPDGFCMETGRHWVYPVNYPERKYQLDMVRTALFQNTLVCLPTGLGKTFIAAVVMYNFYRWYPKKIIVFLAPTKPLVAQQIKACFDIIGIPASDTAEMTGTSSTIQKRQETWNTKRVIFATPQVLSNDLVAQVCPASDICCIVFDEAHKAKGNYSYCQIINTLKKYNCTFRVLALSATPGSDKESIVEVFRNLMISKMKFLTDDSAEVKKYTHNRDVDVVTVSQNSHLKEISGRLLNILSRNLAKLMQKGIVPKTVNVSNLTSFQMKTYYDRLSTQPVYGAKTTEINDLRQSCLIAMNISKAYELLVGYGKGAFLAHIAQTKTDSTNKFLVHTLNNDLDLKSLIIDIESSTFDHPKLQKLEEILINHFLEAEDRCEDTKVIIFSEYRNSVIEIKEHISKHDPLIRAVAFVGQSKKGGIGLTQIEQKKIMQDFKSNKFNTLISTCVGEEGLDIGEVDLILCYDASKSPVRLVQRMGRTGRKRDGRVVLLLTEGKEHQKYLSSKKQQTNVMKNIPTWNLVPINNQISSPRMVPTGVNPELFRKVLVIPKTDGIGEILKKSAKKGSLTSTINDNTSPFTTINQIVSKWSGTIPTFDYLQGFETEQFMSLKPRDRVTAELGNTRNARSSGYDPHKWREWLSSEQCPAEAPKASNSGDLISLMKLAERISANEREQLTQTSEMASEASYDILYWTDKLVPGKKKGKSSSSVSSNKQSSVKSKPTKKRPALPTPPLFKDDDVFVNLDTPQPALIPQAQVKTKISVAEEIDKLVQSLSFLCKVPQVKTEIPVKKMTESVSLLANTFKPEMKPDFDFMPPDLSILDHIFADMKIEKKNVKVFAKTTEVITKITPAKGEFSKRARLTSTPIRKLSSRASSSSYATAKSNLSDIKAPNISPVVIKERPAVENAKIVIVPPVLDFNLDIDMDSFHSIDDDKEPLGVIEAVSSPVEVAAIQTEDNSQETCISDDLLCALADEIEAQKLEPQENGVSNGKPDVPTEPQNTEKGLEPTADHFDDEDFDLEDIDILEKHCKEIEAEVSIRQESSVQENANLDNSKNIKPAPIIKVDDDTLVDEEDWENFDTQIAYELEIKKEHSLFTAKATQDDPIVLSSQDSDDEIGKRKIVKGGVISDDELVEDDKTNSKSNGHDQRQSNAGKRPSTQQSDSEDDPQPAKRPKPMKKKPNFFLTQASLSGEDSADDDFTQMDHYEASFIQEQPLTQPGIDMHAEYLKSTKSPIIRGKFKIPEITNDRHGCDPNPNRSTEDTYLEDSFCVPPELVNESEESSEDILEIMEKRLKEQRRSKKKQKNNEEVVPGKKKLRRIIKPVLSDSDEEIEHKGLVEKMPPKNDERESKPEDQNIPSTSKSSLPQKAPTAKPQVSPVVSSMIIKEKDKTMAPPRELPVKNTAMNAIKTSLPPPLPPPKEVRKAGEYPLLEQKTVPRLSNWQVQSSSSNVSSGKEKDIPKKSIGFNTTTMSEMSSVTAAEDTLIVVSSKQIQQAPELVTCLNAKHKLKVLIKTLPNGIDYVLSERLAGIRIKIGDASSYIPNSELAKSITTLKSYFPYGLVFFENDKTCPVPAASADFRPHRAPNWANNLRKTLCFLRTNKIKFLFSTNQEETAKYLANICCKEAKTSNRIENLPNESANCQARFNFYNKMPSINVVKAMKLVKKFPTVAEFFEACSTLESIKKVLELKDTAAIPLYKVLNQPNN